MAARSPDAPEPPTRCSHITTPVQGFESRDLGFMAACSPDAPGLATRSSHDGTGSEARGLWIQV